MGGGATGDCTDGPPDRDRGEREGSCSGGPPGGVSCEEALARVYEYLDGELDSAAQEKIHQHLEVCKRCYPYFNFERLFLEYVREKGLSAERNAELEERVHALLSEEGS